MTQRPHRLKSTLVSRASIIAIVAAAGSLGSVPTAQASCEDALVVTAPVTISTPHSCVVARNVHGNVINNTTIGPPGENDPGFLVSTGGILGSLTNNGTIRGGGFHLGGIGEDDGEEEEGYGPTGALTIATNVRDGVINAGSILSVDGNGIQLGVGGDVDGEIDPLLALMSGNIINNGRISSDHGDGIAALFGSMSGSLTNGVLGTIGGHDAIHIASTFDSWTGGISNSGVISGTSSAIRIGDYDTAQPDDVNFSGGIHNALGAKIVGGIGPSISVSGTSFAGGIFNDGTITQVAPVSTFFEGGIDGEAIVVSSHTFAGGITNSGLIEGIEGNAIWIKGSVDTFSDGISNSGTITGSGDGVLVEAIHFNGGINNSKLIRGGVSRDGVFVDAQSFTGGFTNSGTISGGYAGVEIIADEFHGNVLNSGLIEGRGDLFDPAFVENVGVHYGDIINNGTYSATSDALSLTIGTLTGSITNTGLIEATSPNSEAVYLNIGNGTTFSNIAGGHITGDVFFAGKNAVTFVGGQGSVAGNLTGSQNSAAANDDNILIRGTQSFVSQSGTGAGNASNFSNFTVESGGVAVLGSTSVGSSGGNGYNLNNVTNLNVNAGGRLYVDNQSALNVGALTLAPNPSTPGTGSTLQFYLSQPATAAGAPQVNFGTIAATGPVSLGGRLQAVIDPLAFSGSGLTEYDFVGAITTTGSIAGNFADEGILNGSAFYRLQHTINNGSVDLHLTRIPFSAPDCSENGRQLGQLLERLFQGGNLTPQEQTLFTFLSSIPEDQICQTFDNVSGARVADLGSVVVETAGPWKNLVNDRLNGLGSVGCNLAGEGGCLNRFASNESAATQTMTDATPGSDPFEWLKTGTRRVGDTGTWGRLVGVWGGTDSKPGSSGTDFTLTGGILGVDHVFTEEWLAGVAMQITTDDISFQQSADNASVDSIEVGAYASYGDTRFYVNVNTSFIWHDFKVHRDLEHNGAFASYNGTTISGYAEAGRIFEYESLRIQPILGASFAHLQTDGYNEHGGAPSLLSVQDADFTTFKSLLGARFALPFELESGRKIVPEARAVWAHEFADDHSAFWATIQGSPANTPPIQIKGRSYPRDTAIIGAGLTAPLSDEASVTLDYDAAINPEMTSNTVSAGLRITW